MTFYPLAFRLENYGLEAGRSTVLAFDHEADEVVELELDVVPRSITRRRPTEQEARLAGDLKLAFDAFPPEESTS